MSRHSNKFDDEESGSYSDEIDRPTLNEVRAAADIIVNIEQALALDMKWFRVRVREGHVRIYGSVESLEIKREIEELLRRDPRVRDLELNLILRDPEIDD